MSRVGKEPIKVPQGIKVEYDEKSRKVKVTSSKGELEYVLPESIGYKEEEGSISLFVEKENKTAKAMWGTARAMVNNMIQGLTEGFSKELELNGVGYKMELKDKLIIYIGYSHPVVVKVPEEVKLNLQKNVLKGESINKELLGNFFANIHNLKPCDPYKQKGFKYPGRYYQKKVGKKTK